MSSGGTRAARAATSRQVKQELVRLLFGKKYSRTGPEGHKKLDSAAYSYAELKSAYLEKLQEIHPDKHKSKQNHAVEDSKKLFFELQNAWDHYEDMAKAMTKTQSTQSDFTKFGVGCSFSDSEEERALRSEITDQACRGWFSSGLLSAREESDKKISIKATTTSLIDDNLFVESTSESEPMEAEKPRRSPRTLIPNHIVKKS